jgi:hypothetical protein
LRFDSEKISMKFLVTASLFSFGLSKLRGKTSKLIEKTKERIQISKAFFKLFEIKAVFIRNLGSSKKR